MNARCAIFAAFLVGGTVSAGAAQDLWESSFPAAAVRERNVYFAARYVGTAGREHRQEVWREGSRRLRRITDDKLDLLIEKDSSGEYQYRLAARMTLLIRLRRSFRRGFCLLDTLYSGRRSSISLPSCSLVYTLPRRSAQVSSSLRLSTQESHLRR